jgi:hypothetical protein
LNDVEGNNALIGRFIKNTVWKKYSSGVKTGGQLVGLKITSI